MKTKFIAFILLLLSCQGISAMPVKELKKSMLYFELLASFKNAKMTIPLSEFEIEIVNNTYDKPMRGLTGDNGVILFPDFNLDPHSSYTLHIYKGWNKPREELCQIDLDTRKFVQNHRYFTEKLHKDAFISFTIDGEHLVNDMPTCKLLKTPNRPEPVVVGNISDEAAR